eukprot:132712_1
MAEVSVESEKDITAPRFCATQQDVTNWKKKYSDIFVGNQDDVDKKFALKTKLDEWFNKIQKWSLEHGGYWHDDNPYCKLKWVLWSKLLVVINLKRSLDTVHHSQGMNRNRKLSIGGIHTKVPNKKKKHCVS